MVAGQPGVMLMLTLVQQDAKNKISEVITSEIFIKP
jgi:hypothetical protein